MNVFLIVGDGVRDVINVAGQWVVGRMVMGGTWACINGVWHQVVVKQVLADGARILMIEADMNVLLHEQHETITAVEDFS